MKSLPVIAIVIALFITTIIPTSNTFSKPIPIQEEEEAETLKIGSEVVLVNVVVTDNNNRFVNNLSKDEFEIYEDGLKQEMSFFNKQDQPLSLGIIIDASTSMLESGKLEEARRAVSVILSTSNANDEAFLIKFDDSITILQEFTSDFDLLNQQVKRIRPFGGTAIYDALIHSMTYMKKKSKKLRQALILITDGLDQHSRSSVKDVLPIAQVTGIPCYVVGLYSPEEQAALASGNTVRLDTGQVVDNPTITLRALAEETAGRAYFPTSQKELVPIAKQIVDELRNAYALGYYPPVSSLDGRYHTISVISKSKKFNIRTRRGYLSKL
ncbi:MAG: VWA domain-containing protein [Acidobacteriota bacterium]